MARLARADVFAPDEAAVVHVTNRVVRRCFLLGDDPVTERNYDHRKPWIENRQCAKMLCPQLNTFHFSLLRDEGLTR